MTARPLPPHTPMTDGKLWDVLHELYGVGSFDAAGDVPWWKFRAAETSKVKASRLKNDRSLADLYVAILYCRAHGIDVRAVTYLMRHIPKAWAWWTDRSHQLVQTPDEAYAAAIRHESSDPDTTWLDRLLRTSPAMREEVLAEWRAR